MRFDELSLPVGKTLTIKLVGLDYKSHSFEGQLVGYRRGKNIIVAIPAKPGQILLQTGSTVSVSAILPEGTIGFEADIEYIHELPFLYLVLEYPVGLDFDRRRKEPRFPVDTAIEIFGHTGLGIKTRVMHGYMLDVSEHGARIVVEKELTSMITQIDVGVQLSAHALERNMTIIAQVRNNAALAEDYPDCGFAYGIEFIEVDAADGLFMTAYCLRQTLDNLALNSSD